MPLIRQRQLAALMMLLSACRHFQRHSATPFAADYFHYADAAIRHAMADG
jgi:hypothetical protein